MPSFITTLGMLFLITGLTLTISRGFPADTPGGPHARRRSWATGATRRSSGRSSSSPSCTSCCATRAGACTPSPPAATSIAAAEAGININRIKIGNFILTSTLGGFAGILEAFRIGSIDPLAGGSNIMFLGVASGVIGGTAIAGGAGTIIGGLVGGIVLGVLQDGFTLQGINAFTFDIIIGAAILLAMVANIHLARLRGARPQ